MLLFPVQIGYWRRPCKTPPWISLFSSICFFTTYRYSLVNLLFHEVFFCFHSFALLFSLPEMYFFIFTYWNSAHLSEVKSDPSSFRKSSQMLPCWNLHKINKAFRPLFLFYIIYHSLFFFELTNWVWVSFSLNGKFLE